MTPKELIENSQEQLKAKIHDAIYDFETETGVSVYEVSVVRGAVFGKEKPRLLGVDIIIKL